MEMHDSDSECKTVPSHISNNRALWKLKFDRFVLLFRSRIVPKKQILLLQCLTLFFVLPLTLLGYTCSDRDIRRRDYAHPRVFVYNLEMNDGIHQTSRRLNEYEKKDNKLKNFKFIRRFLEMTNSEFDAKKHIENSRNYKTKKRDLFVHDDCVEQYNWQLTSFPSCNDIHGLDMMGISEEGIRIINNGYWRDVWEVPDYDGQKIALKTFRFQHDFTYRNVDRHRRDALIMERLTSSPYVVNIYGYCAHSSFSEYSDGGDINEFMWPAQGSNNLTKVDKLTIASHVAAGIASLHNFDKEGRASVAHTDITPTQFILINGVFKLNDFNRCRFLAWNVNRNEVCTYIVGNNPRKFRSPEEYRHDQQDEKVDVYSMGNIFYVLLTNKWPFAQESDEDAQNMVIKGERPFIDETILESNDVADVVLLQAMEMCFVNEPRGRASARDVLDYISETLDTIDHKGDALRRFPPSFKTLRRLS